MNAYVYTLHVTVYIPCQFSPQRYFHIKMDSLPTELEKQVGSGKVPLEVLSMQLFEAISIIS